MADGNLVQSGRPDEEKLDKLIAYLSSHIDPTTFFTSNPFELKDLHTALQRGLAEILEDLDPMLHDAVERAQRPEYAIKIDEEEIFATRGIEWDDLVPSEIAEMDEETAIRFLRSAREEIAWLKSELSRWRAHMYNAKETKRVKEVVRGEQGMERERAIRNSFTYHPNPRPCEEGQGQG